MLLSDYTTQVQFLIHDQTNADFTQAELTNAINNARTAVALDFHCVRAVYLNAIGAPVSLIANQEVYSLIAPGGVNGQVVGANVSAGGANYTSATVVTFAAGPGGSTLALGAPVITGGAVTGVNMTRWGQGYTPGSAPAVTITDSGGGSGATASAVLFNNAFNVISITNVWNNQRYMLRFRAFTLFQAYMRPQSTYTGRPMIWTVHEQTGYVLIQPTPDQAYVSEWDVLCLPMPLANLTDNDVQVVPPWNDAVQYYAAMLCLMKLQNFEQADFYRKIYSDRVPRIIVGAGGVRIPNPYHRTYQRRVSR
jgi:hypothetical protein